MFIIILKHTTQNLMWFFLFYFDFSYKILLLTPPNNLFLKHNFLIRINLVFQFFFKFSFIIIFCNFFYVFISFVFVALSLSLGILYFKQVASSLLSHNVISFAPFVVGIRTTELTTLVILFLLAQSQHYTQLWWTTTTDDDFAKY